ncbi:MAG: cupin domain-containing protein [Pseudomonadota bacterium]
MQFPSITAATFLAQYWQKKPLFCPGGCSNFSAPISADELAGLALEAEVESRIVTTNADDYSLIHGPFDEAVFTQPAQTPWTLLVNAVDLWVPELASLYDEFDFLPRWRMDDIMVSFATTGAGVGPHFDQYDVFLVQASGERTWKLGQFCDASTPVKSGSDLRLLATFTESTRIHMQPGDVLYIPPGLAHWGIADTEGLTFSVGFRAPTLDELVDDLAMMVAEDERQTVYSDPPLTPAMAKTDIDDAFVAQAQRLMRNLVEDEARFADWFARFVTNPKYPDLLNITGEERRARIQGKDYVNGRPLEDQDTSRES